MTALPASFRAALSLVALSSCFASGPIPATGGGCKGESGRLFHAAEVVAVMASKELGCATKQVTVSPGAAGSWDAVGCGQRARYTCEDDSVGGCSLDDAAERGGCQRVAR